MWVIGPGAKWSGCSISESGNRVCETIKIKSVMRSQNIRRRRNPQACGACRERSDGQRPKCSSCRERAKDCRCPGLPDTLTTPLEQELSRVWDRIDQISTALRRQYRGAITHHRAVVLAIMETP
ncbi:uncharacterized protein BDW43DRAFT_233675 [Aspergillus alliaceus]|uniref:uncharacterized protein n=1 Tax=Petromyces alliaceus TaxID=209559 RepID=UPI0012A44138|nr:uncharacterized protein BDW43DRAFT_233675 [Aspergillus alliaceus]KAB8227967.1 hypothetical protein BDW43DRAFT_233675 [Aspergillus alliaceus]